MRENGLPDDPRDLDEGQQLQHKETGVVWEVVGFDEESGLPIIREQPEATEKERKEDRNGD